MPNIITISRPDVVALIEAAAGKFTAGNMTEAIALGMKRLLKQEACAGSLFGAHYGAVRVRDGVDLIKPVLMDALDAETGDEIGR